MIINYIGKPIQAQNLRQVEQKSISKVTCCFVPMLCALHWPSPCQCFGYTGHLCVQHSHTVLSADPASGPAGEGQEHGHCVPGPHGSPGAT